MAFDLSIDPDRRLATVTHHGQSDKAECLRVLDLLAADPRIGPNFGVLIDVRQISFTPTFDELRQLTHHLSTNLRNRVAFLAATPLQYGIARQSGTMSQMRGAQVETFYQPEEAIAWLTGEPNDASAAG